MSEHETAAAERKKPVDYDELYPGRFLKAGLLQGKNVTLRIAYVTVEKLPQEDGKERTRGILGFDKTELELVLNSTNGQCIKAMFGKRVQEWVGKRVTLMPDQDKFGRETVDCIRIYGSPDIAAPIQVTVSLPRKRPKTMTMHTTDSAPPKEHAR